MNKKNVNRVANLFLKNTDSSEDLETILDYILYHEEFICIEKEDEYGKILIGCYDEDRLTLFNLIKNNLEKIYKIDLELEINCINYIITTHAHIIVDFDFYELIDSTIKANDYLKNLFE